MFMVDDRRLWAEDETLFLFRVFLTEKAGSLSSNSPRIAEIAELLDRRIGSVHRKLEDIRSNEPSYIAGGRKPTNCAELVKDVWKGLYSDYDRTRRRIEDAYTSVNGAVVAHEELDLEEIPPGLDIPVDATRREGQQLFRCIVAMNFEQRCCITGLATRGLLVASHIRPWVESGPEERTDPSNGLYLNRLHDGLFDRHLMTLDDDMCIEYADLVRRENSEEAFETFFGRYEGRRIREPSLYSVDTEFLDEHRRISHRMWADSRSRILEGRDDTGDCSLWIPSELAFPDDHDRPPILYQGGGILRIPFDVPTELRNPVVGVMLGEMGVADRALVPEASVHEHRNLSPRVAYVGMPGGLLPVEPVSGIPGLTERLADEQLGFGALAFVALHGLDHPVIERGFHRTVEHHFHTSEGRIGPRDHSDGFNDSRDGS